MSNHKPYGSLITGIVKWVSPIYLTGIVKWVSPIYLTGIVKWVSPIYLSLKLHHFETPIKPLLHFDGAITQATQTGIPFSWEDYVVLVDWTGRVVREDKRGAINNQLPPILERLSIETNIWIKNATQFEQQHKQQFRRRKAASL